MLADLLFLVEHVGEFKFALKRRYMLLASIEYHKSFAETFLNIFCVRTYFILSFIVHIYCYASIFTLIVNLISLTLISVMKNSSLDLTQP